MVATGTNSGGVFCPLTSVFPVSLRKRGSGSNGGSPWNGLGSRAPSSTLGRCGSHRAKPPTLFQPRSPVSSQPPAAGWEGLGEAAWLPGSTHTDRPRLEGGPVCLPCVATSPPRCTYKYTFASQTPSQPCFWRTQPETRMSQPQQPPPHQLFFTLTKIQLFLMLLQSTLSFSSGHMVQSGSDLTHTWQRTTDPVTPHFSFSQTVFLLPHSLPVSMGGDTLNTHMLYFGPNNTYPISANECQVQ